jgi:hypothetical protein
MPPPGPVFYVAEPDRLISDYLQSTVNGSVDSDGIDNTLARERRNLVILKFREQLSRGVLDQGHYEALRTLKQHLEEGRISNLSSSNSSRKASRWATLSEDLLI